MNLELRKIFVKNWNMSLLEAEKFMKVEIFLHTRKKRKDYRKANQINVINAYLSAFSEAKFLSDIYSLAKTKFSLSNRNKVFAIFVNVPISYMKGFSPNCIRFRIFRDYSVKFDVQQIGASMRDLTLGNKE